MSDTHPPTRLLVLRERDTMLALAQRKLSSAEQKRLGEELDQALTLADDEATLVMASLKSAWGL